MPLQDKVTMVVTLIGLASLASGTLTWPTHDVALGGLSLTLSGNMLLGLITVGLAWAGADAIVRSHPRVRFGKLRRPFLHCVLPTAVTAAAWVLLARLPDLKSLVLGTAITGGALAVLISAEYHVADAAAAGLGVPEVLQFVTYPVAALLFGTAYPASPDANVARVVTLASAFLALRLLGEDDLPLGRILSASAGVGLLLGAISWLVHPRTASAVTYSLTLVVFFYMLAGLVRQFLRGKLRREVFLEYTLVTLVALVLLSYFTR